MILLIAAQASAGPGVNIRCKATHAVGCEGAACRSEVPEEGDDIYVGLELSTVSGRGNLCTYTVATLCLFRYRETVWMRL